MIENRIIIVVSSLDQAGMNMMRYLLDKKSFEAKEIEVPDSWPSGEYRIYQSKEISILEIPESQIYTDYFDGHIQAELLIFASKHSSAAGKKALLVHTTGIWQKENGYGGRDHEVSLVPSNLMSYAYDRIKFHQTNELEEYWTGIECTHHGPTALSIPVAYFETGGTKEEWNDLRACGLIAKVILESCNAWLTQKLPNKPALIGIGGNHYCSRFIKILDQGGFALGHVIPKYALNDLPLDLIDQAFMKTIAQDKVFLIDKKGTRSDQRTRIINHIKSKNYSWEYA